MSYTRIPEFASGTFALDGHLSRGFVWFTILATVCFAGCGSSEERVDVHPVRGSVLVGGPPTAGVKLQFHPTDATDQIFPRATTDALGEFQLSTYKPEDGIPAGEYVVTASWKQIDAGGEDIEMHPDEMADAEEKLDVAVTDPVTTPLKVTVAENENQLEPFNIAVAKNDTGKRKRKRK